MLVTLTITAEVQRVSGPFASRDAVVEQLVEEVEGADPGTLSLDSPGGAEIECEVVSWEVTAE